MINDFPMIIDKAGQYTVIPGFFKKPPAPFFVLMTPPYPVLLPVPT
jgi:hypothetical protein